MKTLLCLVAFIAIICFHGTESTGILPIFGLCYQQCPYNLQGRWTADDGIAYYITHVPSKCSVIWNSETDGSLPYSSAFSGYVNGLTLIGYWSYTPRVPFFTYEYGILAIEIVDVNKMRVLSALAPYKPQYWTRKQYLPLGLGFF